MDMPALSAMTRPAFSPVPVMPEERKDEPRKTREGARAA
jgi:hypothetical protein